MSRLTEGLVQVYTGDGKGKTTAALGLALRAIGQGMKVCFVMFMKGDQNVGEVRAAERLAPQLTLRQFGATREQLAARSAGPWWQARFTEDDQRMAGEGLQFAREAIASGDYGVVVLDEACVAMEVGLLDVDDVLAMIRERPVHVEVVLTGRSAPPAIVEAADLVTVMQSAKHPLQRGVSARRGIEF